MKIQENKEDSSPLISKVPTAEVTLYHFDSGNLRGFLAPVSDSVTISPKLTVGSLFAGIGGFDLGLERTGGFEVKWQVEIDEYCRRVLEKHWPHVKRYGDIREVADVERVDVLCGGFPCQPVSLAGDRKGQADERWLWPEFARIIRMVRPRYVLVENTPGLLTLGMGDVLGSLAECGYDAEWGVVSAADMGAPHLRRRVWIIAYPASDLRRASGDEGPIASYGRGSLLADTFSERYGRQATAGATASDEEWNHPSFEPSGRAVLCQIESGREDVSDADSAGLQVTARAGLRVFSGQTAAFQGRESGGASPARRHQWAVEPNVGRMAHGIPARVDRLKGLGNAVVPQIVEWIGRRILDYERSLASSEVSA